MANANTTTVYSPNHSIKIHKWKVREGFQVNANQIILLYELPNNDDKEIKRLKSTKCGVVKKRHYREGDVVDVEKALLDLSDCIHATVIKDMCADCGADLRQDDNGNQSEANIPMVHSVPELKVSQELALELGKADTVRLLKDRKLVLLVDLDQTVIHTTNDNVPNNLKGVYHFQLYGPHSPWYHTRIRPGTFEFLENVAPYYELHICTFGARNYAHTIAQFLDEDGKYFSHRILSRDECLSLTCKNDNLKALFPCGDSMVCIIDDREDVWNMATNLIQVKPYHFFQHTGDINAPPGMSKHELDGKGVDFKELEAKARAKQSAKEDEESEHKKEENEHEPIEKTESKDENQTESIEQSQQPTALQNNEQEIEKEKEEEIEEGEVEVEVVEKEIEQEKSENTIPNEENNSNEKPLETESNIDEKPNTNDNDDVAENNKNETSTKTNNERLVEGNLIEIEDPDDYLLYLETILHTIHQRFYAYYDEHKHIPDLKSLVPKIRSEVLVGKVLVFSGLVPTQVKLEKSRAYLIARSLGATVTQQLTDETTHLVASTAGTFKVNAARKMPNIHIVSPEWLWACAERWECVEEKLFPLDPKKSFKSRQPPAHCHSPEHMPDYSNLTESSSAIPNEEAQVKFIDTINPMLSFSNDDLEAMNKDVDEMFESDSSSDGGSIDDELDNVEGEIDESDRKIRKRKAIKNFDEDNKRQKICHIENETAPGTSRKNEKQNEDGEEEEEDKSSSSSSSNTSDNDEDDMGSINAKFRRGEDLDLESNDSSAETERSNDNNDDEDDGEWNMMGAALEREFLGMD